MTWLKGKPGWFALYQPFCRLDGVLYTPRYDMIIFGLRERVK